MKNEGTVDRAIRVALGVALLIIGFAAVGGTGGTIVGLVGLAPLLTGLAGWCPLYSVLGIKTTGAADTA